jgi:hypothetical protein
VALYVHALADASVMSWKDVDGRRIDSLEVDGIFVIAERRETAPVLTESELQRQHDIVLRVAAAVPAVIPARFGSLVDEAELSAILRARQDVIQTTLDHVRDNVQMTLRMSSEKPQPPVTVPSSSVTGRDYLSRRRQALFPTTPAFAEPALRELTPYVRDVRTKRSERGGLTLYHLIRRTDVDDYRQALSSVATPGIVVSGPFAPFAFAPDLFA